ncbi:hypothetical protein B0T18DRAFT_77839 [Schizothecium vesticola]|uniref:Uncharacterized protein n=1 Tax=Schizothecium vesticola TaxID=314040 RepID=A0AA40KAF0_9PEZI|nr:hypothetical protein B0T18DRAFT_77839 [Schizothecium vesticola]
MGPRLRWRAVAGAQMACCGGRKSTAPRWRNGGHCRVSTSAIVPRRQRWGKLVISAVEGEPSLAALPLQPDDVELCDHQHYHPKVASPAQRTWICHSLAPISKLLHTATANGPWRGPLLHIAARALPTSRRQLALGIMVVDMGWAANATSSDSRAAHLGGTAQCHASPTPSMPGFGFMKDGGADASCGASSRHQQHFPSFPRLRWIGCA